MNFYGDDTRWFVARVINWEDTYRGRVQIRILGLHSENVSDEDLPWAKCVLPTTEGGVSGIGRIPQLLNGAFVFGLFLDGKLSQMPIVLGSLTHNEFLSSVQKEQIAASGRSHLENRRGFIPGQTSRSDIVDGVILDPDLVTMYDNGAANRETRSIIAMQYLLDAGVANEKAAAGVVGNLLGESNLVPDGPKGSVGEEGIAQWNPQVLRLEKLQQHAKEKFPGQSYQDFFVQLNFLVWEMKNKGPHSTPLLFDRSITHEFKVEVPYSQQKDSNATKYFMQRYERPLDPASRLSKRMDHAQEAYDFYQESKLLTAQFAASGA